MAEKKGEGFFAYPKAFARELLKEIQGAGKKTGISGKLNDLFLSPGDPGFAEKYGAEAEKEILEEQAKKAASKKGRGF